MNENNRYAGYSLDQLEKVVNDFSPDPILPHDEPILICMQEAVNAAKNGSFAVGACITDRDGKIIERGRNHVPEHYRSDYHAEMDAMNKFEERTKGSADAADFIVFSSLEPCPMCTIRLITAGIGQVYWAADDIETGMMRTMDRLTPGWVAMTNEQVFGVAKCSPELKELGWELFAASARVLVSTSKRTADVYLNKD